MEIDYHERMKLAHQLCFPLYAAARKVVNAYTPLLKPLGLTYTQYVACLALWESGETTVGDLCRRLYLDCGTLTPLLKKLEGEGYLTRVRSRTDERVVCLSVTEKGWALREKAREIPGRMGSCAPLSPEEGACLHRLLHKLLEGPDPEER